MQNSIIISFFVLFFSLFTSNANAAIDLKINEGNTIQTLDKSNTQQQIADLKNIIFDKKISLKEKKKQVRTWAKTAKNDKNHQLWMIVLGFGLIFVAAPILIFLGLLSSFNLSGNNTRGQDIAGIALFIGGIIAAIFGFITLWDYLPKKGFLITAAIFGGLALIFTLISGAGSLAFFGITALAFLLLGVLKKG